MNPFVRKSKNPFISMKQVILEAQAAATAAAAVAAAEAASASNAAAIQSADENEECRELNHTPSNVSHPSSTAGNSHSKPINHLAPHVKASSAAQQSVASPQQEIYFPSTQAHSGDCIDEHGLAGFFFRVTLLSCSSLQGKNENGVSDPIVQMERKNKCRRSCIA